MIGNKVTSIFQFVVLKEFVHRYIGITFKIGKSLYAEQAIDRSIHHG